MSEAEPTTAEAVREAVAHALENVRETKAHYLALRNGSDGPESDPFTAEVDEAARAVTAAEERLAAARRTLLAFFAA